KEKALEIKEYNRNKILKKYKDSNIPEETSQLNKLNVYLNSIINRLAALSINYVEQEERLSHSKVKNMI
ncbi:7448_t:CDS:1, partial [Cetraspora pellucida]